MEQLNLEHQNLIYSIIYKYFRFYNNKEDLFQGGYIGLMNALNNYDVTKGTKFTTYAYTYIYGEMMKLINQDKNIKVSRNISILYLKISKVAALLNQKLMREPTTLEIADFLKISEHLVIEALQSAEVILDIDDMQPKYQEDIIENLALKEVLENLSYEELRLIQNRYQHDLTQAETALKMGMSQVQVSRKEKKILSKLKKQLF